MILSNRILLSIETSCDETAAAIVDSEYGIHSSIVASQIDLHAKYGGVVPAIATKQHVRDINWVVKAALEEANITPNELEAIAVTVGPGLPGSLAVGIAAAKALSLGWNKPFVAVNHLEGHIFSAELEGARIEFPCIYLLVSGGHCMLVYASSRGRYKLIGTTRDDSVGEAYDKVARELGFEYPGGPIIDRLAPTGKDRYDFPRPLLQKGYDFSFSGLKSSVRRTIDQENNIIKEDIAASFVAACMDVLIFKLQKAVEEYHPRSAVIVGGVSKSPVLRKLIDDGALGNTKVVFPSLKYSTDNAAMIGAAGWWQLINKGPSSINIGMIPRLELPTE